MKEIEFKYYDNYLKSAEFTDKKCQVCSRECRCLEGVYFEHGKNIESVCVYCLVDGKATVNIPSYIRQRIRKNVEEFYKEKESTDIEQIIVKNIYELERTPPVPWIQYNDWPVCCGDFTRYKGEWGKEEFTEKSLKGDGKKFLFQILDDFSKEKVDDEDVFWDDIGENTAIFVFQCINCGKLIAVAQSY